METTPKQEILPRKDIQNWMDDHERKEEAFHAALLETMEGIQKEIKNIGYLISIQGGNR